MIVKDDSWLGYCIRQFLYLNEIQNQLFHLSIHSFRYTRYLMICLSIAKSEYQIFEFARFLHTFISPKVDWYVNSIIDTDVWMLISCWIRRKKMSSLWRHISWKMFIQTDV